MAKDTCVSDWLSANYDKEKEKGKSDKQIQAIAFAKCGASKNKDKDSSHNDSMHKKDIDELVIKITSKLRHKRKRSRSKVENELERAQDKQRLGTSRDPQLVARLQAELGTFKQKEKIKRDDSETKRKVLGKIKQVGAKKRDIKRGKLGSKKEKIQEIKDTLKKSRKSDKKTFGTENQTALQKLNDIEKRRGRPLTGKLAREKAKLLKKQTKIKAGERKALEGKSKAQKVEREGVIRERKGKTSETVEELKEIKETLKKQGINTKDLDKKIRVLESSALGIEARTKQEFPTALETQKRDIQSAKAKKLAEESRKETAEKLGKKLAAQMLGGQVSLEKLGAEVNKKRIGFKLTTLKEERGVIKNKITQIENEKTRLLAKTADQATIDVLNKVFKARLEEENKQLALYNSDIEFHELAEKDDARALGFFGEGGGRKKTVLAGSGAKLATDILQTIEDKNIPKITKSQWKNLVNDLGASGKADDLDLLIRLLDNSALVDTSVEDKKESTKPKTDFTSEEDISVKPSSVVKSGVSGVGKKNIKPKNPTFAEQVAARARAKKEEPKLLKNKDKSKDKDKEKKSMGDHLDMVNKSLLSIIAQVDPFEYINKIAEDIKKKDYNTIEIISKAMPKRDLTPRMKKWSKDRLNKYFRDHPSSVFLPPEQRRSKRNKKGRKDKKNKKDDANSMINKEKKKLGTINNRIKELNKIKSELKQGKNPMRLTLSKMQKILDFKLKEKAKLEDGIRILNKMKAEKNKKK